MRKRAAAKSVSKDGKSVSSKRGNGNQAEENLRYSDDKSNEVNNVDAVVPDDAVQSSQKLRRMGRDFTDFQDPLDPKVSFLCASLQVAARNAAQDPCNAPPHTPICTLLPDLGQSTGSARRSGTFPELSDRFARCRLHSRREQCWQPGAALCLPSPLTCRRSPRESLE